MINIYTDKKIRKSGDIRRHDFRFNIRDVPFSRKLSCLMLSEGAARTETGSERMQLILGRTLRKYETRANSELGGAGATPASSGGAGASSVSSGGAGVLAASYGGVPVVRDLAVAISGNEGFAASTQREGPDLMHIRPTYGGRTISYVCSATPSLLEMNTEYGFVQFCFDDKDSIRVRGKGIGLRIFIALNPHEFCISRLDGTWQASFEEAGDFLFVPLKGDVDFDCEWGRDWGRESGQIRKRMGADKAVIDICPSDSGDDFEFAIHFSMSNVERYSEYKAFDECVADAQSDYTDWYSMYPIVPSKYEDMKKLAVYCIWICYTAPMGILKDNIVLFDRRSSGAFSWHQAYHAMAAAAGNIDIAVQIMHSMFLYQDEYGEIPDIVDERYINILATKPPFHGFAMLFIMDCADDALTNAHCESLYGPLSKWYSWWMTIRDTDNDGIPQYNQGCESGNDFTMMLSKGTPVECPDLITYIILLGEALGKIAKKLGYNDEADEWFARSKRMTDALIAEFWDGEKFVARLSGSHEIVEFDEIDSLSPIMLGNRLPKAIVAKMAKTLMDPDKYYTHHGFRNAPRRSTIRHNVFSRFSGGASGHLYGGAPQPGFLEGFTQLKLIIGLYEAGYTELARDVCIGFCDTNLELMPDFGYRETVPTSENKWRPVEAIGFGKCSALSSAIFLVLAGFLASISKEGE